MTAGLDPRYERRVRFLLRAFPRRYRAARTQEILSTLADVERPLTKRPSLGTAIDLVRAGWAERLRTRPPLHHWFSYRLTGQLPVEYRDWMLDDVFGGLYWLRSSLFGSVLLSTSLLILSLFGPSDTPLLRTMFLIQVPLFTVVWCLSYRKRRSDLLNNHGLDEFGDPLPAPHAETPWLPPPPMVIQRVRIALRAGPFFTALGAGCVAALAFGAIALARSPLQLGALMVVTCASLVATNRVVPAMDQKPEEQLRIPREWTASALPVVPVFVAALILPGLFPPIAHALFTLAGTAPAWLYLGLYAFALERRRGAAVPTPFTWQRTVFEPPVIPPRDAN
jgi:hypothetical protein